MGGKFVGSCALAVISAVDTRPRIIAPRTIVRSAMMEVFEFIT
jgi:hypothetical protein